VRSASQTEAERTSVTSCPAADCRFGYLGRDPVRHAAIDWAAIGYGFHTARMESTAAMAGVFCYRLRSAYPRVPSCRPGWLRRK
jgi:hypothetical protein